MWKVAILGAVLLLAGCKDTVIVEDNGPNRHERESAMENCVGEFIVRTAPVELRIACTQAIYGGN